MTNGDVKYTYKDASGWHNQVVDSGSISGDSQTSLQLTSAGWPAISYTSAYPSSLGYAYEDASGWHVQTVDIPAGSFSSLQLTSSGWPAISYTDWTNQQLKYAYKSPS